MQGKDWFAKEDGQYQCCQAVRDWNLLRDNYRFYRFLTEVEDVLNTSQDEFTHLAAMRMLVRRLIVNSYWLRNQFLEPDPKTGVSVLLLYDELGFPLTVQTVTFAPGTTSNIHNHGTWGVVAVLRGQEKNTIWRRTPDPNSLNILETSGEIDLFPGDIISFTQDAIHCVQALGDEPTVTFNIYGETDSKLRFEFDPVSHTAKKF
jgi:predicted metal-dependent enzyme (double-stranded beta helix superfamily)